MNNSINNCTTKIAQLSHENDILKGIIGELICAQLQEAKLPFNGTDKWVDNVIDINSELNNIGLSIKLDCAGEVDADGNTYNQELYVSIENGDTSMDDLYIQINNFLDDKPRKGISR